MTQMLRQDELPEVNSERWLSIESLPGEEWRSVPGYEGLYEVSNYGRVLSVSHLVNTRGGTRSTKSIILRAKYNHFGYCTVVLCDNKKRKKIMLHRVVAMAFIPNPTSFPFINHKDENKSNNCVWNLEWCTAKYNTNYGSCIERRRLAQMTKHTNDKKVRQLDLDGNEIRVYHSMSEAAREMGVDKSRLSQCCLHKKYALTSCGYKWEFA